MTLYHFKSDLLIWALFDAYNKKVEISHKYRKFQQFIQKFNCSYTFFTKLRMKMNITNKLNIKVIEYVNVLV